MNCGDHTRLKGKGGRSMVRLFRPGLGSRLSDLCMGRCAPLSQKAQDGQVENVRALMLSHLGVAQIKVSALSRRIQHAPDIQGLWFLRSELMASLASVHGETRARRDMTEITAVFQTALPRALQTRAGNFRH